MVHHAVVVGDSSRCNDKAVLMAVPIDFNDPCMAHFLSAYSITPEQAAISAVFLPGVLEKRFEAYRQGTRFVHYTTAEAAAAIIRNKCVWLRNANAMNDYSELHHGISRVISFFRDENAKQFWDRLENLHVGLAREVRELYDNWLHDLRYNTYMICVSEHQADENVIGRLSMWRAYGQPNGVALIFNAAAFHNSSDAVQTYSHPVFYFSDEQVKAVFTQVVHGVVMEDVVAAMSKDDLKNYVYNMLETFSLGLKHPGFREELEWRVVHRPGAAASDRVSCSVQSVRGVPQRVYSLPLANVEEEDLHGVAITDRSETRTIGLRVLFMRVTSVVVGSKIVAVHHG